MMIMEMRLSMPKCGVCGWKFTSWALVKHAELCEDDSKAEARPYAPEIDDLIKQLEEDEANA